VEKISLFDKTVDNLDKETGSYHHTSTKPTAQRGEQREGESLREDTKTAAGRTKEGPVRSDGEILKNKEDPAKFQKDATILKFPSGNQPEENNAVISK
jgi:hypothetical protein